MLRLVEMECPNCGGALKRIKRDTCKCQYCNSYFLIDRDKENIVPVEQIDNGKKPANTLVELFCAAASILIVLSVILHLLQKSEVETQPDYQVTMIQEETFSSELFRYLVTEAYGKDYSEVTEEELAELIYLKIDYENGEEYIEYQRIGKERARSVIPKEKRTRTYQDLQFFPMLRELHM